MTALHTPQQNGMVEHFNQTTHESALAMLKDAEMSHGFWPEAHAYANYMHNHSPTKALTCSTPNETFYGKKPSMAVLCVFGSRCHVQVPPEQCRKLDAHSIDGIFCGLECQSKAYKVWVPSKHKFIASRDVIIYEKVLILDDNNEPLLPPTAPMQGVPSSPSVPARFEGVSSDIINLIDNATKLSLVPPMSPPSTPTLPPHPPSLPPPTQPPASKPKPDPTPRPLRRSERVTHPSWKKEAADKQKEKEEKEKADHKAQREACMTE